MNFIMKEEELFCEKKTISKAENKLKKYTRYSTKIFARE